jgi:hypothetical protein
VIQSITVNAIGVIAVGSGSDSEILRLPLKRLYTQPQLQVAGEIHMKNATRLALALVFLLTLSPYAAPQTQQSGTKLATILSLIDGSDVLKVRGNEIWFEHRNFVLPGKWVDHFDDSGNEPTYINSEAWVPRWTGDLSAPFVSKNRLLPEGSQFDVRLVTPQDRGSITVLEQPNAQNNFTLSVLLDDDLAVGAAWYQVELRRKQP